MVDKILNDLLIFHQQNGFRSLGHGLAVQFPAQIRGWSGSTGQADFKGGPLAYSTPDPDIAFSEFASNLLPIDFFLLLML